MISAIQPRQWLKRPNTIGCGGRAWRLRREAAIVIASEAKQSRGHRALRLLDPRVAPLLAMKIRNARRASERRGAVSSLPSAPRVRRAQAAERRPSLAESARRAP